MLDARDGFELFVAARTFERAVPLRLHLLLSLEMHFTLSAKGAVLAFGAELIRQKSQLTLLALAQVDDNISYAVELDQVLVVGVAYQVLSVSLEVNLACLLQRNGKCGPIKVPVLAFLHVRVSHLRLTFCQIFLLNIDL